MTRVATLALIAVLVAGCGSGTRTVTVTTTRAAPAPATPTIVDTAAGSCRAYDQDSDEYVIVSGSGAQSVCDAVVRRWSGSGSFWSLEPSQDPARTYEGDSAVCDLVNSGVELDVYDDGGTINGRSTCGDLVSRGWEQIGP